MKNGLKQNQNKVVIALLDEDESIAERVQAELKDFAVYHIRPGPDWFIHLKNCRPKLIISELFFGEENILDWVAQFDRDKKFRAIPIILFSSIFSESMELDKKLSKRISLFLYKPYDFPILLPNVQNVSKQGRKKQVEKIIPKVLPKILIIDDDEDQRTILKGLLSEKSWEVLEACDGKKGLALFEEQKPDFVLLDIMMPEMDGITVLKRIKKFNPHIPVVMMTAYSDEERAVHCLRNGAEDYLVKPLEAEHLIKRIEQLLEYSEISLSRERFAARLQTITRHLFQNLIKMQQAKRCLVETQQKLIEAEKVAAIAKTTVSLHHEIKNPLAILSGRLQLWQNNYQIHPKFHQDMKQMLKATVRIQEVLSKLSSLTHPVETTYVGTTKMIDVKKSRSKR